MATNKIPAGADVKGVFTAEDVNGDPININTIKRVEVELCNAHTSQKWLQTPGSSDKQLKVEDAAAGKVSIIIDREWTELWKGKSFDAILKVVTDESANNDYIDDEGHAKQIWQDWIKIEESC